MPPNYTQSRATASGFGYPSQQGARPQQQLQLPPNPFGGGSGSSYSQYGAPSGGFGGYSQLGQYQGSMTPFTSGQNPFGMSSGGYTPQMASGSPYSQLGGAQGWSPQRDPTSQFLGAGGQAPNAQMGAQGFVSPVADGGVYGAQKWSSSMGSNGVDIFVPRGTPVKAPVSGTLQPGQNGQLILIGDNGYNFAFRHGMTTAQGRVQAGQQIGIVNDPGLDSLGRAPWGNMPDNYQHLELSVSQGSPYFPATPGGGGNVDAAQWLDSIGYRGNKIGRTPGPPDAGGGGGGMFGGPGGAGGFGSPFGGPGGPGMGMPPGMGMGAPGMGQGGLGAPPGLGMGMPGLPGMSPGLPGMPGMQGNPFMSMMQGNPFMSMLSGSPLGMAPPMMGRPPMAPPMNLPTFGGFGAGPSPMGMGLGNPFSFSGGGGGPMGAAGMMMNPFGGAGPAGAASMYGA